MADPAAFRWDKRALLFAGDVTVRRPDRANAEPFVQIAAHPTPDALSALGAALQGNCGFCIAEQLLPYRIDADAGHFLTLTGGSSGQPKIIRRTQASWIASFAVNAARFALTPDDCIAVFGKLSHSLALYGVLEALHLGVDAYALDGMFPRAQRATLAAHGVSVIYATPTQLRLLAQQAKGATLTDVRLILCGGGNLDHHTREMAEALFPNASVHVFYGAAETSFITLSDSDTPAGSVGRPYPGVILRILDADGAPTSEVGEVWVQSPYLFECYMFGKSDNTQWQDGFVTVGEMGQIDASGNLWLRGRKTRMITIADQNVFPEDIEAVIAATPQFGACAIFSVPDETRGHRLIAVLQGTQDPKVAQAVKDTCREKLGALKTPFKVLFHPSLPLLNSGKVDLVTLSNWLGDNL